MEGRVKELELERGLMMKLGTQTLTEEKENIHNFAGIAKELKERIQAFKMEKQSRRRETGFNPLVSFQN